MTIEIGHEATVEHVVGDQHTAIALGSGDVEVLGTPQIVAWCEAATVAAAASSLEPDETTVGTQVQIDHLRATPVGGVVTANAVVTDVDGRRLTFEVEAHDRSGQIAVGRVIRTVVNRTKFIARVPTA